MHATDSLTARTTRAAKWRAIATAFATGSRFAVGVLLARLLSPADFGIVALTFIVLGFAAPLGDLGMGNAVVQRSVLTERHVRVAFTFSTILGLLVAAAIAATGPLAAAFMGDDRVAVVLRTLAIGFAIQGVSIVPGALLRRRLDFRSQFFIETGSYLLGYGCLSVGLALRGYGYWSLVWGSLLQTLIASAAQLIIVPHARRPLLARRELGELFHFGFGSAVNQCVNYVALNGDNFVVGRVLGAVSLGLYSRAYGLMNLPYTHAASVMSSVLFPAFAQAQGTPARLRRAYLLLTRLTAMISASAMGTMAIVAPHLVRSVYGARWMGVVVPLQILCVAGYFRALYHLGGVVSQSVGWIYSELWRQVVYAALVVGGTFIGAQYGLAGVAVAVSVAILCMFVATGQLALRATETSWAAYFGVQRAALFTASLTCGVAFLLRAWLERLHAGSGVITIVVLAGAAIPWGVAMLWTLGGAGFEPIRERLPKSCLSAIGVIRARAVFGHHANIRPIL